MQKWLILCLLAAATSAAAQDKPRETTVEGAVAACGSIADPKARLACFDSLASAVTKTEEKTEATIAPSSPDETSPGESPRPSAGIDQPQSAGRVPSAGSDLATNDKKPAAGDKAEADRKFLIIPKADDRKFQAVRPSPFTAVITGVVRRQDKFYVRLDNGETWKQTSSVRPRTPKIGMTVTFTKGRLGGWFAKFDDRPGKYNFTLVKPR